MNSKRASVPIGAQLLFGFVIPTVVLIYLSDDTRLGPVWSMAVALGFPVLLELYGLATGRKASWLSLFAIIGILLVGVISLLGLNEQWLGVRRAAIYFAGAAALMIILRFKPTLVDKAAGTMLDLQAIRAAATAHAAVDVERAIRARLWWFAALLLVIGVWSYVLTIIVITAPTGSSAFNAEYAQLRLLSLPYVSLPFLIGTVVLLLSTTSRLEKLTGLQAEQLLKNKR